MTETCAGCSTAYAVGLPRCPNCGSEERVMPKAHVDQDPTAMNSISGEPLAIDPESGRIEEPALSDRPELDESEPEQDGAETGAVAEPEPELFDPAEHTVSEVNAYLDSLDQETEEGISEFDRVLDAEKAGQNRKGIVG